MSALSVAAHDVRATLRDYIALTKPNVMSLLLFTTLMAMFIAQRGVPPLLTMLWTVLGGALAAGASGAINMYLDRDIDAAMTRTRNRPIPSGRIPAIHALAFGIVLGIASFAVLASTVNVLAATLALAGLAIYVGVYTIWLKRTSVQNIVIGGAAGAIPPLVGWAAVTGRVDITAALLFLIVFLWTPPHFWALALLAKNEYAKAGIPMMPVVRGDEETKRQIVAYSIALVALTLVLTPLRIMGWLYLACALALGALFLVLAVRVAREGTSAIERTMYKYSMLYLALLFAAMVADRFGRGSGM